MDILRFLAIVSFAVLAITFFISNAYQKGIISKELDDKLHKIILNLASDVILIYMALLADSEGISDFVPSLVIALSGTALLVGIAYMISVGMVKLLDR